MPVTVPATACFGVAGPVLSDAVKVTNLPWSIEGERLERDLGIARVHLINDFAAQLEIRLRLVSFDDCSCEADSAKRNACRQRDQHGGHGDEAGNDAGTWPRCAGPTSPAAT